MKRFRGGLVFKAHKLVYHSTLGWRVIKKKASDREAAYHRNSLSGPSSYLRLTGSCIAQRKAQGPSRTCNKSKEEEEEAEASQVIQGYLAHKKQPPPPQDQHRTLGIGLL